MLEDSDGSSVRGFFQPEDPHSPVYPSVGRCLERGFARERCAVGDIVHNPCDDVARWGTVHVDRVYTCFPMFLVCIQLAGGFLFGAYLTWHGVFFFVFTGEQEHS